MNASRGIWSYILLSFIIFSACTHEYKNNTDDYISSAQSSEFSQSDESSRSDQPVNLLDSVQGLPTDFDQNNTDHIIAYFVHLLNTNDMQTIQIDDIEDRDYLYKLYAVSKIQYLYQNTPYLSQPVLQVRNIQNSDSKWDYYLTVDVQDGKSFFQTGEQVWSVKVGYPEYSGDDEGLAILQVKDANKANAMITILNDDTEDVNKIIDMRRIAFIDTFESPKALGPEERTGYLIVNVPPSGTFGEGGFMTYITQTDMDFWSEKIFGISVHVDPQSRFYNSIAYAGGPENVYSSCYGWGPPIIKENFIFRVEDGESVHYYYEDYDLLPMTFEDENVPKRILRYTLKDDMVYSCVDVTAEIPPSFYLDDMKAYLEGES